MKEEKTPYAMIDIFEDGETKILCSQCQTGVTLTIMELVRGGTWGPCDCGIKWDFEINVESTPQLD